MHRIEISSAGGGGARVLLDGVPLNGLTAISIYMDVDGAREVVLTLDHPQVIAEGDFEVMKRLPEYEEPADDGVHSQTP